MLDISVIIVSWNARGHLRNCLASIRAESGAVSLEVIVVDNASADGSPDMVAEEFPEVMLIRSNENLGFAKANNIGIEKATGALVALVNSDVILHPGCFDALAGIFEKEPGVGLAGPKVFGANGKLQLSCGRLPNVWNTTCEFLLLNRFASWCSLLSGFQLQEESYGKRREVEVLSGCFWVARRVVFETVGGLDGRFFFYAEDVDWCKRCKDAGWKILFMPEASITHFGGGSASNDPLRYGIEMLRANLLYWHKHHGRVGRFAFFLLALIQHCCRMIVRGGLEMFSGKRGAENAKKIKEHWICLRWLVTGRGIESSGNKKAEPAN